MIRFAVALSLSGLLAVSADAQYQAPPAGTVALTPDQREAALEAGARQALDESLQNGAGDRKVHGEVGVEVGSRGERAAYGTVVAPIGQNSVAAFSYGTGQGPRWHGRGHYRDTSVGAAFSSDSQRPTSAGADGTDPD